MKFNHRCSRWSPATTVETPAWLRSFGGGHRRSGGWQLLVRPNAIMVEKETKILTRGLIGLYKKRGSSYPGGVEKRLRKGSLSPTTFRFLGTQFSFFSPPLSGLNIECSWVLGFRGRNKKSQRKWGYSIHIGIFSCKNYV